MAQLNRAQAFTETGQSINIPLTSLRNDDGSLLSTAAASGKFGLISGGYGVGTVKLEGEAASGNSKTSTLMGSFPIPQNFEPASLLSLSVPSKVTATPATSGQLTMQAYKSDGNGGVTGSNLVTSGPASLTTSWVSASFTVNPSSLVPGDELVIFARSVIDDTTGATGAKANIGKLSAVMTTRM